jgi:PAS domain S-box-containing protein
MALRSRALPYLAQVLLLAIIYFTTAKLGLMLAIPPGNATAVWPPSGIALAAVLWLGYRLWPAVWLGATLVNAMTGVSPVIATSIGIGNTLEALLGAFLLRRVADYHGPFEHVRQVFNFVLFAGVSCLIAATVGTTGLYLEGLLDGLSYLSNWWTWWLGDVVGILVMTPLLLAWGRRFQITWRPRLSGEILCFYGLLLTVGQMVFGQWLPSPITKPLAYLLIPFILWATFRFSQGELVTAIAVIAAIAIGGTVHGLGPFVGGTVHQSLFLLQVFVGFFALLGFTLSAVESERRRAEQALRRMRDDLESRVQERTSGLENANQALREARNELEQRIREHTADLVKANAQLKEEIAQRKRTEGVLRESEERFRMMADSAPILIWVADADRHCTYFNRGWLEFTGRSLEQERGYPWLQDVHPEDLDRCLRAYVTAFDMHQLLRIEYRMKRHDMVYRWLLDSVVPRYLPEGTFVGYIGGTIDITERKQAEASRDQLAAIVESSDDAIIGKTLEGIITSWNSGAEKIFGYKASEVLGQPISILIPPGYPNEEPQILERLKRGKCSEHYETVRIRKDGRLIDVSLSISPVMDTTGKIIGASEIARDITEQKRAEETLFHAQKMEAVGQLTGGLAHDFNNLLTIISGNLQMLEDSLGDDPLPRKLVQSALKVAGRGAELVRRLLAFSRRQALQPQVVNLNEIVAGMMPLLHRTLAENVEIATVEATALWPALADPTQLETALLNLAVNARDAMRRGGKLTIETGNVVLDAAYPACEAEITPGEYVMLAVSDSGTGMSAETVKRAFEPFFTTKAAGEGTGLGLSMIYGFIKQSCGHVKIYSELGQGTTVKLYLPRSKSVAKPVVRRHAFEVQHARSGETILVVEDEADVRELAVAFLTELGYRVFEAAEAQAALGLLEREPTIDLLFVDLVLSGIINGVELAAEAQRRQPNLKVLYTSGYPKNPIVHNGRLDQGKHLLTKPYTRDDLTRAVRSLLDNLQ